MLKSTIENTQNNGMFSNRRIHPFHYEEEKKDRLVLRIPERLMLNMSNSNTTEFTQSFIPSNVHLRNIKFDPNKLRQLKESVRGNRFQINYNPENIKRHKHPRVLMPLKNNCKIKAFSVESKQRKPYHKHLRSMSPSNSLLHERAQEATDEETPLFNKLVADKNISLPNSFRSHQPNMLHLPTENDKIMNLKSRKTRILDHIMPTSPGIMGVRSPLDHILNTRKISTGSEMNQLRVTQNRFDFSETKMPNGDNYIFSKPSVNESLNKFIKTHSRAQSERKVSEKQSVDSFLLKLEKNLRRNQERAMEDENDEFVKRIIYSEFTSPQRSHLDFTFH